MPYEASPFVAGTTIVPQIPAKRCTGIAPTTSSILNLSNIGTVTTTMIPPTAPISVAAPNDGVRGSAVIETNPAKQPFNIIVKSGFL